ncbi:unnamed protein product [Heligmosomoides polygyrus]|uniref:Peroxin/Ferlin domain-containing protein n=1 Tax=Heligmosomoides polygyrus TaxID=6339 RepID=A0A183FW95_HELPZ|nr:unnamed protein product [Heligmosomoides polygyrus]
MESSPSLNIPGCMLSISAGVDGVVWSLAADGTVYALSSGFDLFSGNAVHIFVQRTEVVKEYQKHAFMRGFVSFQGSSSGVSAWMEGSRAVNGLYERLPSREWSWIENEYRLIDKEKYEDGWTYSETIDGAYCAAKKKGRARRRRWQRRCRYDGRGPWILVEAPPMRCIDVQRKQGDRILVWGVTTDGQVLLRQGVTAEQSQGTTWKHIVSDFCITAICAASPTCVYATTAEGRLLRRECSDQTDMECVDWSEVVYSPLRGVFSFCASEDFVVLLPANDTQLVLIDVKKAKSKTSLSIPKAIFITMDTQQNLYYCDGSNIVKLEKYCDSANQLLGTDYRVVESVSDGNYAQCCFT